MRILCLCPTYGRPKLVANLLAQFQAQTHPRHLCTLLIYDDAGQYEPCCGYNWQVISTPQRCRHLQGKYNDMLAHFGVLGSGQYDAIVPMDDDDIYLPNHLETYAAALARHKWVYPAQIWSLHNRAVPVLDRPQWAACGVRLDALQAVGGWPETKAGNGDQLFLRSLYELCPPGDPTINGSPTFVFRWASTEHPHAQGYCTPDKVAGAWYDNFPQHDKTFVPALQPVMDVQTKAVFQLFGHAPPV